jgi:adenine-specific DNA-methyltransferase
VIKYLGSKRLLLPQILECIQACKGPVRSVLDLFSGTSRVGHALKQHGYKVISNDLTTYAHALATCYVQADREAVLRDAQRLIAEFNELPGKPGYFTETFCKRSRFFQPKNGARIDAIREEIARKGLDPELEAVLLVSLMEAADRVDSTVGLQMAYLKTWAARAHNDLDLRLPEVLPQAAGGKGQALCGDALLAASSLEVDLAYFDPPYNQHSYLGNYHVWESLIRWDKPPVYGVACKRVDVQQRKSPFNSKPQAFEALQDVIKALKARWIVVSFSNEGYLEREQIEALLRTRGRVRTVALEHRRHIGAAIGICNSRGERVGTPGKRTNTEFLFCVRVAG